MVVISRRILREFGSRYPDARRPLAAWLRAVSAADWKNPVSVRTTFQDVDFVGEKAILNIAWNRYRLIAFIAYSVRTVYVKAILTQKEYSKELWKQ